MSALQPLSAQADPPHGGFEAALLRLEQQLEALQAALGTRDGAAIQQQAAAVQQALTQLIEQRTGAARHDAAPAMRQRLARAVAQVGAQRDALARAGAALDRAIAVLVPGAGEAIYSARGLASPARSAASIAA